MNKKGKLIAVMLVLALVLCLLPATALALNDGEEAPETAAEETALPELPEEPDTAPIHNGPEDVLYTVETSVVYNNGGTVYNNGGVVYNNAGLVYNNAGTVYNNAGTVYANGGVVYNNAGTVYNNGAALYDNAAPTEAFAAEEPGDAPEAAEPEDAPEVEEPEDAAETEEPEDALTEALPEEEEPVLVEEDVLFAEDYSSFVDIEPLEADEDTEEESYVIRPKEGYAILSAETEGGRLEAQEDGSYSLSELDGKIVVTMAFEAQAPVFSLQPGTYAEEQVLELTAAEDAAIYFTDDGSEPEEGMGRYTGPIVLKEGAVIKAIAVAPGAGPSEQAEAAYAIVRVEGPEFKEQKPNYIPESQALVVTNDGPVDAQVTGVALSGENARQFYLSHISGRKVPAEAAIASYWTVQPVAGLKEGTYTALLTVSLDSGETVEWELSFTVK